MSDLLEKLRQSHVAAQQHGIVWEPLYSALSMARKSGAVDHAIHEDVGADVLMTLVGALPEIIARLEAYEALDGLGDRMGDALEALLRSRGVTTTVEPAGGEG